jgi:hypothetical protein
VRRVIEELLVGGGLVARQTEATYTVLVTLAMALDDTTLSENIQTNFKRGEYFKTDDDLSDPTGTPFLPHFPVPSRPLPVIMTRTTGLKVFLDEVIGEHTPLMRILKVTSQRFVLHHRACVRAWPPC